MISKERLIEGLKFGIISSVGIGTATIVDDVVKLNTQDQKTKFKKVCFKLALMAITSYAVKKTTSVAEEAIDNGVKTVSGFVDAYNEEKARVEEFNNYIQNDVSATHKSAAHFKEYLNTTTKARREDGFGFDDWLVEYEKLKKENATDELAEKRNGITKEAKDEPGQND